jgi:hypothetical protein
MIEQDVLRLDVAVDYAFLAGVFQPALLITFNIPVT